MSEHILETLWKSIKMLVTNPRSFVRTLRRVFEPMRQDYQKRLNMSLREWLIYHQQNIVFDKCYWMGVRALKNPFDSWIYQEIIHEVKPDILIEIGSAEGGSTLYFANLFDLIGKGQVISIDIDRTNFKVKHDRIIVITGDCSSQDVAGKVSQLCQGKRTLVIHDGDHSKDAVLRDLAIYSKLVSVGSYLIVEDGVIDLFKPGDGMGRLYEGPLKAVEEFLIANPDFVVDMEREKYLLTYNPRGFLKRIK
ncbi:MAG: CmcI family methyltransferase [Sedimentisphaerales bacterium]